MSACVRCSASRVRANLTETPAGPVCPECLSHQPAAMRRAEPAPHVGPSWILAALDNGQVVIDEGPTRETRHTESPYGLVVQDVSAPVSRIMRAAKTRKGKR